MTSDTNVAGAISSMFVLKARSCEKIATVIGCVSRAERQRHEQVVPGPQELEDRERGDRGQPQRQDDAHEDVDLRSAVDPRASIRSFGMPMKKFRSRKMAKGSAEGGVEEDQAEHGVEDPDAGRRG